jgi:hypothetical protein
VAFTACERACQRERDLLRRFIKYLPASPGVPSDLGHIAMNGRAAIQTTA